MGPAEGREPNSLCTSIKPKEHPRLSVGDKEKRWTRFFTSPRPKAPPDVGGNVPRAAPWTLLATEHAEPKRTLLCSPQPLASVRWLSDTRVTSALLGPAHDLTSCCIFYTWAAAGVEDKDAASHANVWAGTVLVSSYSRQGIGLFSAWSITRQFITHRKIRIVGLTLSPVPRGLTRRLLGLAADGAAHSCSFPHRCTPSHRFLSPAS